MLKIISNSKVINKIIKGSNLFSLKEEAVASSTNKSAKLKNNVLKTTIGFI